MEQYIVGLGDSIKKAALVTTTIATIDPYLIKLEEMMNNKETLKIIKIITI
jgi:hypothetical protein